MSVSRENGVFRLESLETEPKINVLVDAPKNALRLVSRPFYSEQVVYGWYEEVRKLKLVGESKQDLAREHTFTTVLTIASELNIINSFIHITDRKFHDLITFRSKIVVATFTDTSNYLALYDEKLNLVKEIEFKFNITSLFANNDHVYVWRLEDRKFSVLNWDLEMCEPSEFGQSSSKREPFYISENEKVHIKDDKLYKVNRKNKTIYVMSLDNGKLVKEIIITDNATNKEVLKRVFKHIGKNKFEFTVDNEGKIIIVSSKLEWIQIYNSFGLIRTEFKVLKYIKPNERINNKINCVGCADEGYLLLNDARTGCMYFV